MSFIGNKIHTGLLGKTVLIGVLLIPACGSMPSKQAEAPAPATNAKIAATACVDVPIPAFDENIYVMSAEGLKNVILTVHNPSFNFNFPPTGGGFPAWSPDGSKIAFVSTRDVNYEGWTTACDGSVAWSANDEIYVMNADGSNPTRLTHNPGVDWFPAWSPDGSKIAFYSDRDGSDEIYVMNADGSNPTKLTNGQGSNNSPAWSPDGRRIAFLSIRDGAVQIYVMNADGSNQTQLTRANVTFDSLDWSPDGTKIAFTGSADDHDVIYVMNADGSNQIRLTNDSEAWRMDSPDWSPDGTKIAFHIAREGSTGIYVMDADGSNRTALLTTGVGGSDFASPDWSPDGTTIVLSGIHQVGMR